VSVAVSVGWREEPGLLDGGIDRLLQQGIEAGALSLHGFEIGDLRSKRDAELVRGILGQPQLFRIIAFECNHGDTSFG
jgi:hypothetical protein